MTQTTFLEFLEAMATQRYQVAIDLVRAEVLAPTIRDADGAEVIRLRTLGEPDPEHVRMFAVQYDAAEKRQKELDALADDDDLFSE